MIAFSPARWVFLLFLMISWSIAIHAQGPGQPMPNYPLSSFRFNFINPGSRATGMGQAFIALSDDATGSETNPAGLTALITPQLFGEVRLVSNTFRTLAPSVAEIRYADFTESVFSPTFFSFVYPFRNWAFAVYRQDLANYSVNLDQQSVVVPGVHFLLSPSQNPFQVNEFHSKIDVNTTNYGFSAAYRWGARVNLGASLRATRFAYSTLETQPAELLLPYYHVPAGETEAILMRLDGTDWDFSWVAGVILRPLDWLKLGGVYRSGTRHEFLAVFDENLYRGGTLEPARSEIPGFRLAIPDRYGIGVAVMPVDRLTITFDAIRIEYGDLTRQFVEYLQPEFEDDFGFANGNEFHLGGEYTFFVRNVPVSLRAGFYSDPGNALHFLGDRLGNDVIYFGPQTAVPVGQVWDDFPRAQGALFPDPGTDYHKTFGIGLTWKGHLQTDFALDLSRDTDYFVISALYNF